MTDQTTMMLFGTFDHLHAGHENLFKQARALVSKQTNSYLIAILARDKTVKQIKSTPPDNNEKTRQKNLEETRWADLVLLGEKRDKYKAIKKFQPNIIALGYDQFAFTHQLEKLIIDLRLDIKIVRLAPYKPNIYKSSLIREQNAEPLTPHTSEESSALESLKLIQE
ncbi:adenylyltransferase/cytidyltransferase family protein [Candidatus Peregrinibacteria bacterium]|jgi:FAD synthetase|nr:adenylyltransferase/cytidyltransferase family protein [Candidatus Peregrinibacteria bacterium]MBT4056096.1 adenylyltransferase/cytidyltransferase family protein [Candidatus Peregrinibacteria bacterium]